MNARVLKITSLTLFTGIAISLPVTAAFAQNSVTEQLQAIMDRYPGGSMKVQPAVIRYEEDDTFRRASEAGEPCLECMGVHRIDVKQIGSTDDRRAPRGIEAEEAKAVGMVSCRNPNIWGGKYNLPTGVIVGRSDVVVTVNHAFLREERSDAQGNWKPRIIGRYDYKTDCVFKIVRKGPDGRNHTVFQTAIVSKVSGGYDGPLTDESGDWAVLRLAQAPPVSVTGQPFDYKRTTQGDVVKGLPITQFSNSPAANGSLTLLVSQGQTTSRVYSGGSLVFDHTADTLPGSSGGVITTQGSNGGHVVIGVHTGASNVEANTAVRLDGEFLRALDAAVRASDAGGVSI